jgi:hypothetical protein
VQAARWARELSWAVGLALNAAGLDGPGGASVLGMAKKKMQKSWRHINDHGWQRYLEIIRFS